MTIYEIRVIAKDIGIDPKRMNKTELIRSIQINEGYLPCFKTAGTFCDQTDCCWKSDCLK